MQIIKEAREFYADDFLEIEDQVSQFTLDVLNKLDV